MSVFQLIIGNKNYSSWSFRPWLLMRKLGIDFEEKQVWFGEQFKSSVQDYSPTGKVPILIHGETIVWDSLAIAEYLADIYPQAWPEDRGDRTIARCISAEMHSGLMALRNHLPMNCRAENRIVDLTDESLQKDIQRVQAIWQECRQKHSLDGPWLFGQFTIADAMFAPVVFRFHTYNVPCHGLVAGYMQTMLQDADVLDWWNAAKQESAVVIDDEAGLPPQ